MGSGDGVLILDLYVAELILKARCSSPELSLSVQLIYFQCHALGNLSSPSGFLTLNSPPIPTHSGLSFLPGPGIDTLWSRLEQSWEELFWFIPFSQKSRWHGSLSGIWHGLTSHLPFESLQLELGHTRCGLVYHGMSRRFIAQLCSTYFLLFIFSAILTKRKLDFMDWPLMSHSLFFSFISRQFDF